MLTREQIEKWRFKLAYEAHTEQGREEVTELCNLAIAALEGREVWATFDPRKTDLPIPESIGATREAAISCLETQTGRLYSWETYQALGFTVAPYRLVKMES